MEIMTKGNEWYFGWGFSVCRQCLSMTSKSDFPLLWQNLQEGIHHEVLTYFYHLSFIKLDCEQTISKISSLFFYIWWYLFIFLMYHYHHVLTECVPLILTILSYQLSLLASPWDAIHSISPTSQIFPLCCCCLEFADCIPCWEIPPHTHTHKRDVLVMPLNWIWWWGSSSGEHGVLPHCHYSQVYFDLEC